MKHRLQHSYYDITRVEPLQLLPFLLENGTFIDHDTMGEINPNVIQEMMEKEAETNCGSSDWLSEMKSKNTSGKIEVLRVLYIYVTKFVNSATIFA